MQFVYPLPRSEGYEMIFSQFSGHRCFFTSLLQYKVPCSCNSVHAHTYMYLSALKYMHHCVIGDMVS